MRMSSSPSVWSLEANGLLGQLPSVGWGRGGRAQSVQVRESSGPHTAPTLMSPDRTNLGPGHHLYRQETLFSCFKSC